MTADLISSLTVARLLLLLVALPLEFADLYDSEAP